MSVPEVDVTLPPSVEQDAALAVDVLRRFADGAPFTPGDALRVVKAIERLHDSGHAPDGGGWRCFHCGEAFTDRRCAALHFGADEDCTPACQIKGAEGGLLKALRETEEALFKATCALHDESADALRSWREVGSRHAGALIAAEQVGYDRGLADMRHQVEVLSRALCWHGDRARMATTREEWQQTVDEAIKFVMDNPEEGRPSFPSWGAA